MSQKKPLFFNLDSIENLSTADMVPALKMLYSGSIPKYKHSKLKFIKVRAGYSFLLNPEALFNDKSTDPSYISQYIKLAGRRNYGMYKLYKITYLDLSYYPEILLDKIKHNPLLTIANNKIYFKYEEI